MADVFAVAAPPTPPAGWYRDPTGLSILRYWTGHEWSEWVSDGETVTPEPRRTLSLPDSEPLGLDTTERAPAGSVTRAVGATRQPPRWSWTLATVLILGPALMWAVYALLVGIQIPFSEWTGDGDYTVVAFMSLYAGAAAVLGLTVVAISACWRRPLSRRWGAAASGTAIAILLATFAFGLVGFDSISFVVGGVVSLAPWAYLWWAVMDGHSTRVRMVAPLAVFLTGLVGIVVVGSL